MAPIGLKEALQILERDYVSPDDQAARAQSRLVHEGEELETEEMRMSLWASLKANKMVLLYTLAAYSCAATYGYDTIANNATIAMPGFRLFFGQIDPTTHIPYLETYWVSLWCALSNAGQIVGSLMAGWIAQVIGRRYTAMSFAAITVLGVALQFIATTGGVLLAGKTINGIAVGALLAVGTTYASEIAPSRLRGPLLSGLAFFAIIMQAVGLGVVRALVPNLTTSSFRTAFALQWIVGGLPIFLFAFIPESPTWLIQRGREAAARNSLCRLYGVENLIDARLAHLSNVLQEESKHTTQSSYIQCFQGTDLRRTLIVCLLFFGNGLIGSAFLTQNIYFLILAGLPPIHCFDINIGGFCLALLIIPLTTTFSDKIGRRPLYLTGALGNAIGMLVVGTLGYSYTAATNWALAVILNVLITWQLCTCFMVSWSLAPEISSHRLRQQTQGIGYVIQALTSLSFSLVTPYMYNIGAGDLGAKTGFIFFALSLLLFVLAWWAIPETKGLSIEDIDGLFARRVGARKFIAPEETSANEEKRSY